MGHRVEGNGVGVDNEVTRNKLAYSGRFFSADGKCCVHGTGVASDRGSYPA